MRNLKKFLALVMAMVMAFSLMLTVNAKDIVTEFSDRDQADPAFTEAVDVLSGMKVFQGDPEGTFRPASTITRAEVAALIYRLATGDVDDVRAGLYANYGNFADVAENDWFAGYVGYCANAGYIKGHGGYFNPYGQVTGYEVLAMILRAAGYDKNHEFEGAAWQTNVSALATQLQVLTDVKTTHYGNTLHLASRRDVVASLLFNTAYKVHMVEYTPIGGYNQYDNLLGSNKNPTLGKKYFGLAKYQSVIVGNQETGESCTLVSTKEAKYKDANGSEYTVDTRYAYPGSVIGRANVSPAAKDNIAVGEGIKLAINTGLDLFGHEVKVWYNEDDTGNKTTYALYDKATLATIVHSIDKAGTVEGNTLSKGTTDADAAKAGLGAAARLAGFNVNLNTSKAWYSENYNRIHGDSSGASGAAGYTGTYRPATGLSSRGVQTFATDSPNGLYMLISNNADKTVNVMISLEAEVALIARQDTTTGKTSLTLASNDSDLLPKSSATRATVVTDGVVFTDSLAANSEKTLGSKVTAWKVEGTNNGTAGKYAAKNDNMGHAGTGRPSNALWIKTEKLSEVVTGTVLSYGANNDITLTDGTVIKQSWFRQNTETATPANDKVVATVAGNEVYTYPTPFLAGVTYNIALDQFGRWLGVTSAKDTFVYTTYADYELGGLGTSGIKYAITGVDLEGNKVVNHTVTSMMLNNVAYPSSGNTLATGYNNPTNYFPVTKKVLGDTDSSVGNQILRGANQGFVVNDDGNLTDNIGGYATMANATWTIRAADVSNGFASFTHNGVAGGLLATPNTKFIVVSGTGTDTLDVKTYNGISELLNGSSWVTINATGPNLLTAHAGAGYTAKSYTYFITEADRFNKWDTTSNKQLDTVIVDVRDVTWSNKTDVYFAAPGAVATGAQLAGADPAKNIKQYELYKDGVKGYYWVQTTSTAANELVAGTVSPTVGSADPKGNTFGEFYTLVQLDTVNGVPVYKAIIADTNPATLAYDEVLREERGDNGVCNTNIKYSYVGVTNLSTAVFNKTDGDKGNEVFDVSEAKVVDTFWTTASPYTKIESVQDLNNAISGGYTSITVAAVYDGVKVSAIYVTSVNTILT